MRQSDPSATSVGTIVVWLSLFAAATIIAAVLVDALRWSVQPGVVGLVALLLIAPLVMLANRRRSSTWRSDPWTELALLAVGVTVAWQLIVPAWPSLLPIGSSVDAVHHTALANHIFDHQQLVRDPVAAGESLGEMAVYPPGFAVLTALAAQLGGVQPVAVIYAVAAIAVTMSVLGIASLIAETSDRVARPIAVVVALLVLLVPDYSLGIVLSENYYAQALAQWLIVATGLVVLRHVQRPRWSTAAQIVALLAALLFSYTTWLPVALVVVTLGLLLADRTRWPRRIITIGGLVGPIALLALWYGMMRSGVGSDIVAHEGSTIRDPLRALGFVLPLVALIGLARGWQPSDRRVGLALIAAALLQLAALWLLWQRGLIAGYIYYKGYYLLALLLPLPIGWIVSDAVAGLLRLIRVRSVVRLLQPLSIVAATVGSLLWTPAPATAHPISPDLIDAAMWITRHADPTNAVLALQQPGLPAYWLTVGVLQQPRTEANQALLQAPPRHYTEWYLDPTMPRTLLLQQPTPPALHDGVAVRYANECCVVLEKTDEYAAALERLRPLLVSYRAYNSGGLLWITAQVTDRSGSSDLRLRLALVQDDHTAAAYTLSVPADDHTNALILTLNPATLAAKGFVNDNAVPVESPPAEAPTDALLRLQLLLGDRVVQEQEIGTCCGDPAAPTPTIVQPSGSWSWLQTPPDQTALRPHDFSLGDQIDLIGSDVVQASAQPGKTIDVKLRWRANARITVPYRTFVQLIAVDGGAALSVERDPNHGFSPPWRWQSGDLIDDDRQITLPPDLKPGTYQIVVGMYDPLTGARLEGWQRSPTTERLPNDSLPIGSIEVRP